VSLRLAVLASGGGSNLQALIDAFAGSDLIEIALVISDRSGAGALVRAERAAVRALHIRAGDDAALENALQQSDIDMIALAGYLRLVPAAVVQRYTHRIVNVHPALLPAFGGPGMYGLRVHQAVLAAGCTVSGVTVHHVDERYDEGSIIAQWPVPVEVGDTPESLAARVLQVEHVLYPAALAAQAATVLGRAPSVDSPFEAFRAGPIEGLGHDVQTVIRTEGRR
jgi:phosphoribosylglycinamide formyltransferase 1